MKRRIHVRLALNFVLLLVFVAVVGCQQADVEEAAAVDETVKDEPTTTEAADGGATSTEPSKEEAEARAGDGKAVAKSGEAEASAGNGEARADDAVAGDEGAGEKKDGTGPGKDRVRLKIGGKPGTQFSGACDIGGEKREVSGQVPERFVYDLEGGGISCEIRNETGTGQLKFSITAGGGSQKQKIKATADNVSFSFSGSSLSYTTSSSSDGASSQKTKVTSSSNSSVSSSESR